jgi:hypothetical protein
MENITPAMIMAAVLSVASAIVLLSNAVEKVVKAVKAAKAPNVQQNERIDALEEWRKEVDRKLIRDNDRLQEIDTGNRVTQRALLALLDHGIDGNNIKQMQDAKEALQDHLINHK